MTYKRGFFLLASLLLIPLVLAQTTTQPETTTPTAPDGYDWLANYSTLHNIPTTDHAYAILALLGEGGKEQTIANLKQKIKDAEDAQHCWPQQRCKTRDTTLAILALAKSGTPVEQELTKIKSQLIAAPRTGEWRIQIDSPSNGTCTVSWGAQKKNFDVKGDTILGTSRKYYITINNDLPGGSTTLLGTPNSKLTVDCTQLAGTITLSLIYAKTANDLYIVQSLPNTAKAELTIANACLPDTFGATNCNYEATLEGTWALIEAEETSESPGTLTYLYSTISNDDTQRAYLARLLSIAGKTATSLLDQLATNQRSDGSWKNRDIITSALASLALQPSAGNYQDNLANAKLFLQRSQSNDGSWKQTVRDTAFALLALKGEIGGASIRIPASTRRSGVREICDNAEDDDENGFVDCGDVDVCGRERVCHCENNEKDLDEQDVDCGGKDCKKCPPIGGDAIPETPDEPQDKQPTSLCKFDSDCDNGEVCESGTCTTKTGLRIGVILLFILIGVIILGGVFFYLQYIRTGRIDLKSLFSKKGKKQTFEEFKRMAEFTPIQPGKSPSPARPPSKPATRPTRAIEDEALDRSLKEAEKLLHKK